MMLQTTAVSVGGEAKLATATVAWGAAAKFAAIGAAGGILLMTGVHLGRAVLKTERPAPTTVSAQVSPALPYKSPIAGPLSRSAQRDRPQQDESNASSADPDRQRSAAVRHAESPAGDAGLPLESTGAKRPSAQGMIKGREAPSSVEGSPPSSSAAFPAGSEALDREAMLIREARVLMRQQRFAQANALLAKTRAQFPQGKLTQEREALLIEILERTQQLALARIRARAFLRAYPGSPHASKLERLTE